MKLHPAIRRVGQLVLMSLLWLMTAMPIISFATACIALYDTAAHCLCFGEEGIVKRYFKAFRRELGRGMGLTAVWAVFGFFLYMGMKILQEANLGGFVMAAYLGTLILPLGMACWTVVLESRFIYSFSQLLKNALSFMVKYFPRTLALVALLVATVWAIGSFPLLILLLPAGMAYVQTFLLEQILAEYMLYTETEDPDQDLEQD